MACLRLLGEVWPGPARTVKGGTPLAEYAPGAGSSAALPLTSLGRFEIRRELGRGGFGVVFLAFELVLGREVA